MRNIIICCDGTGNEISENISNVLKLYRCLRKTEKTQPRQLVFYDPGVGTLARPDPWHKLKQDFNAILGLATGYGLDDNVLAAYDFLVHNYQEGDQIYLFGFSRGAYTVRVLAGLIHKVGLITPEQVNLAGSGLIAYKQFSSDEAPKLRGGVASGHRCRPRKARCRRRRSTTRRNSRASPRRAGPPSASSASGIRWRA